MENLIDLTPIFNAAIVLLAGIVSAFVLPWVHRYVLPWIEANTTEKQREGLRIVTRTAVFAAEQLLGNGRGYEKMQHAKEYIRQQGYDVDTDLIEATVMEHFGHLIVLDGADGGEEELDEEEEEPQTPLM